MCRRAERRVPRVDLPAERVVIRLVPALDAPLHFRRGDLRSYMGAPPRRDKESILVGLARPGHRRPRFPEHRRIDVVETAVRVDVRARKIRFDQRRAKGRGRAIEARDMRVLRLAHDRTRRRVGEIGGIVLARVRRIEHERQWRDSRRVKHKGRNARHSLLPLR